jgi:hypothetical protein
MTDIGEQVRRREFVRDMKAATALGQELEEYRSKRDQAVDEWAAWFHAEMDKADPVGFVNRCPDIDDAEKRMITGGRVAELIGVAR